MCANVCKKRDVGRVIKYICIYFLEKFITQHRPGHRKTHHDTHVRVICNECVKQGYLVDEQSRRGEKRKKKENERLFSFEHETRIDHPSKTKSALNLFQQMAEKMAESWSDALLLPPSLALSYSLYFPPLWEERKFLSLPPLIHSLLPFSMQCHRRHFNSRHDALVFFRVRPTDYKMDVGRLMKYLKVSSGENPRER